MRDRYSERNADYLDRIIRMALKNAADKLPVSDKLKSELYNKIIKQRN